MGTKDIEWIDHTREIEAQFCAGLGGEICGSSEGPPPSTIDNTRVVVLDQNIGPVRGHV